MDRNTVTGLILIFLIFIGFSLYNTNKVNKAFEKALAVADADYAKGNLETARTEYIEALRFKQNQPDALAKINEINLNLEIHRRNKNQIHSGCSSQIRLSPKPNQHL